MKNYKTLYLGVKTPKLLREALAKIKVDASDWVYAEKPQTIHLVKVKLSAWFNKKTPPKGAYPTTEEVYLRAKQEGLDVCPPITALELRLDSEEELYKPLVVASRTLNVMGVPKIFCLSRDRNTRYLKLMEAQPDTWWDESIDFVFRTNVIKLSFWARLKNKLI